MTLKQFKKLKPGDILKFKSADTLFTISSKPLLVVHYKNQYGWTFDLFEHEIKDIIYVKPSKTSRKHSKKA